jgi:DNA-binding GntR family transcriptional regulator
MSNIHDRAHRVGGKDPRSRPLPVRSVVGLAYDELRTRIVSGAMGPGQRIGQGELAEELGVSRGSIREALRRLVGDGLVASQVNRGFFVAELGLEVVLDRLEARLLLEPQIARLAADRRTVEDLELLRTTVATEQLATTSADAHDASRAFHLALAAATGNDQLVRLFDVLWVADVGRRLLAQRHATPAWQHDDARQHEEILEAVAACDGDLAETLMRRHDAEALRHWSDRRGDRASPADG